MRAALFIFYLFAFFIGDHSAVSATSTHPNHCLQAQHLEQSKLDQGSDLGFTFIEDNLDTAEDNFSDKAKDKDSVKFPIGKSHLPEQLLAYFHFPVSNPRGKSVKTFAYFPSSPEPIYIIHRVLRI